MADQTKARQDEDEHPCRQRPRPCRDRTPRLHCAEKAMDGLIIKVVQSTKRTLATRSEGDPLKVEADTQYKGADSTQAGTLKVATSTPRQN